MSISETLRKIYDISFNFPQFEGCGVLFAENENPNILCFTKFYAKSINWKEMEKTYNNNKETFDRVIKSREQHKQQNKK